MKMSINSIDLNLSSNDVLVILSAFTHEYLRLNKKYLKTSNPFLEEVLKKDLKTIEEFINVIKAAQRLPC